MPYTNQPRFPQQYPNQDYYGVQTGPRFVMPTVDQTQFQPVNNRQYYQSSFMPSSQSINTSLRGRTINTVDEITPQEVPMDGGCSIFPLADASAIYMKVWGPDGKILTYKFLPEKIEPEETQTTQDNMTIILQRLDRIEELINARPITRTKQQKSEVKKDEHAETSS